MVSFHLDQESHAAADLKAALDYATRAVKAAEKEFGADAEDLLEPLRLVLRSRMALKMDSLDVLERRLSLSLRHLGEGKINTIFARVELGAHLCFLGRFDSAVEALERASSDLGNLPRSALESNREAVEDARGVIEKQLPLAPSKQQRQQPAPSASPSSSSIPPPAVPPLSGGGPVGSSPPSRPAPAPGSIPSPSSPLPGPTPISDARVRKLIDDGAGAEKAGDGYEGRRLLLEAAYLARQGGLPELLREALGSLVEIARPNDVERPSFEYARLLQRYCSACKIHTGPDSLEALEAKLCLGE